MTKITDEELKEINDLRSKISGTIAEVGQITLQTNLLRAEIQELENRSLESSKVFRSLLQEEQKLVNRLSEKYGVGSINFETGEFTPEN
jgi:diphthamide synthase (EF-2-diphthine--ammonia ligase)